MRTIMSSLITAGLLSAIIFQSNKDNRAEFISSAAQAMLQPSPTPQKHQAQKTEQSQPLPIINPDYHDDQPSLEDRLDGALGSSDIDCDGVPNRKDNCILTYNLDQKDRNKNGIGNVCEPDPLDPSISFLACDRDNNGVSDKKDNCPLACNPNQKDANKNGICDVCDQAFPNPVLSSQACPVRRKVKAPKPPHPTKISTSKVTKTSVESNQRNR